MQWAISPDVAKKTARNHDVLTACDLIGQLLNTFEIPYVLTTSSTDGWPNQPAQIHLSYFISFDEQRLTEFEELFPKYEDIGSGRPRSEEEAIGRLLDYPESAIQAFCDREHESEGRALDTLSDKELEEAFGPLIELCNTIDIDIREFAKFALPYVVPTTASECLDEAVRDVGRFIAGGLVAFEMYEITLFDQVLSDFKDRYESN